MELLIVAPVPNLLLPQFFPSPYMAGPQTLESFLILFLLSHSISKPLANPVGPAFQNFLESNHFSTPLLLHSSPSHLRLSSGLLHLSPNGCPYFHPYSMQKMLLVCSVRTPDISSLSVVGEPFPQLLRAHPWELPFNNRSHCPRRCLGYTLSIPLPRVFSQ